MTAIGFVTRTDNGGFRGELKTLSIRARIEIVPNSGKSTEAQPDYRIIAQASRSAPAGSGLAKAAKDYVGLSLARAQSAVWRA
ncbi:DUF736 domain-containing protein [Bradyrhizobium elkanii]|uniref:DUF736 domain-containing protein n=1 Tax=Bradyrhizobium elkanii TaxID=29448 RepID=A0A4U6RMQ2_BRAEL|nr:DUF736 family protein [Bradyrhizobium elkanii]TKV74166.1 DUF736 domain-containing protein [Bradyrhizobium elkanii]